MNLDQIISTLDNTIVPSNCPGWPPSVERARVNLIDALKKGQLFIDYPDHKAVSVSGPCVCLRTLSEIAGLDKILLVHPGIYDTTVSFYWGGNQPVIA